MIVSKDQERAALGKIRKIVEGLGEDSYVGTALKGALELAEKNICHDAAFSCQEYIDEAHKLDGERRKLQDTINGLQKRIDAWGAQADDLAESLACARNERDAIGEDLYDLSHELEATKAAYAAAQLENIHLKAKLYDVMMA